ncbi:hypothetical protein LT875_002436 [Salmonella enterica]|nr:hypothetical protein [Salmonella enterica]
MSYLRNVVPWMLCGFMVVVCISGAIGLFIGYNVADNRFQEEKLQLVTAQNAALAERDKRRIEAEQRNAQLEGKFLNQLQVLNENYQHLSGQLTEELKAEIYTQCHVPPTGAELLRKSVTEANKRK